MIITDAKSLDLMNLYKKDNEKPQSSSRQEAVYRLSAESLMQDESMMRLEFVSLFVRSCITEDYLFKFHENKKIDFFKFKGHRWPR